MLLAMALLLLHPQLAAPAALSDQNPATDENAPASMSTAPVNSTASASAAIEDPPLPAATTALESPSQPADESLAALPVSPVLVAVAAPAPMAFLKSANPMTVSVAQLKAENRRKQLLWTGLTIASSSAAMFDAITTRHAITTYGAVELNPMLRPFAGNASLFVAIQVAPALLDFAAKKMMYSNHQWLRRTWFVPQSASFITSIFCGAHNLSYR